MSTCKLLTSVTRQEEEPLPPQPPHSLLFPNSIDTPAKTMLAETTADPEEKKR